MSQYLKVSSAQGIGGKVMTVLKNIFIFIRTFLGWLPKIICYYLLVVFITMLIPAFFREEMTDGWKAEDNRLAQRLSSTQERVLSIDDYKDAEYWRYKIVSQATDKIDMVNFNYRKDMGGLTFTSVLMEAADRGVKVRLIVDGTSLLDAGNLYTLMNSHPNIDVKIYNPVYPLMPWIGTYRMHEKFIIIDDEIYLLGGRNQNSLFVGEYDDVSRKNRDRDILVYELDKDTHNSLMDVEEYFEEFWAMDDVKITKSYSERNSKDWKKYKNFVGQMSTMRDELMERMPDAFTSVNWFEETLVADRVDFIRGDTKAYNKAPIVYNRLLERMKNGKDIIVETPYIILNRNHYQDLTDLESMDGVHVKYLTNSPETGANLFGSSEQRFKRKAALSTGSDLYEHIGPQSQHTKTVLIDDRLSIVGTFNYDMRSIYLDTESMVCVDSPELNAILRQQAKEKIDSSRQILMNGSVKYGANCKESRISIIKGVMLDFIHIITYPFRRLM